MGRQTKDGVTLIAEAIRKERQEKAEAEAKRQTTAPNVSEITAQFVNNKATRTPATVPIAEGVKNESAKTEPNAEKGDESTDNNNEE